MFWEERFSFLSIPFLQRVEGGVKVRTIFPGSNRRRVLSRSPFSNPPLCGLRIEVLGVATVRSLFGRLVFGSRTALFSPPASQRELPAQASGALLPSSLPL